MPRKSLTIDGVLRSSISVCLGLKDEPVDVAPFNWSLTDGSWRCSRLDTAELKLLFENVAARLEALAQPIVDLRRHIRNCDLTRASRNKRSGALACSFHVGDIVLWSTAKTKTRRKLELTWLGPSVVVKICSPHICLLRSLNDKDFECHIQRMKMYDAQTSAVYYMDVAAQRLYNSHEFEVECFLDVRCTNSQCEIRVKWRVLTSPTWEPLDVIHADLPDMVLAFLRSKPRYGRALRLQGQPPTPGRGMMTQYRV